MSAETNATQAGTPSAGRSAERDRFFYRDVRECAIEAGITRPVTDEDAQAVIDWWLGEPDPGYRPLADLAHGSPEYLAELQRRRDNPGRVLRDKTVREQLLLRWGRLD